jgi:hypothetical protein
MELSMDQNFVLVVFQAEKKLASNLQPFNFFCQRIDFHFSSKFAEVT